MSLTNEDNVRKDVPAGGGMEWKNPAQERKAKMPNEKLL